jgi:[ribosomal protein S5]-alanine N-acetyltransferase
MVVSENIVGKRIFLRSLDAHDVTEKYISFLNDPEVNRYMETRHQHWTSFSVNQYLKEINESKDSLLLGIFTHTGDHIGNIKCGPMHPIHGSAFISLFIGNKNYWGMGIGEEAIRLTCQHSFDSFPLFKINAGMYSDNTASQRAFLKVGFELEAICQSQYQLNENIRTNYIQVGLTKEKFLATR